MYILGVSHVINSNMKFKSPVRNLLHVTNNIPCELKTREQIDVQQGRNTEQEESFKVKKRTIDLLPDAENNIAKLQVSYLHIFIN